MAFSWGRRKVISGGRIGAWKSMKDAGAVRGEKLGLQTWQQKPLSSLNLSICPFPLHPLLVLPSVPKSGSTVSKAGEMVYMSMAMSSLSSPDCRPAPALISPILRATPHAASVTTYPTKRLSRSSALHLFFFHVFCLSSCCFLTFQPSYVKKEHQCQRPPANQNISLYSSEFLKPGLPITIT